MADPFAVLDKKEEPEKKADPFAALAPKAEKKDDPFAALEADRKELYQKPDWSGIPPRSFQENVNNIDTQDTGVMAGVEKAAGGVAASWMMDQQAYKQGTYPTVRNLFTGEDMYEKVTDGWWEYGKGDGDIEEGLESMRGLPTWFEPMGEDVGEEEPDPKLGVMQRRFFDPRIHVMLEDPDRPGQASVYLRNEARATNPLTSVVGWAGVSLLTEPLKVFGRTVDAARRVKMATDEGAPDPQVLDSARTHVRLAMRRLEDNITGEAVKKLGKMEEADADRMVARVRSAYEDIQFSGVSPMEIEQRLINLKTRLMQGSKSSVDLDDDVLLGYINRGREAYKAERRTHSPLSLEWWKNLGGETAERIYDRSARLRSQLAAMKTPEADRAIATMDLAAGSTTRGEIRYAHAFKDVFEGLNNRQKELFNDLVMFRRFETILSYNANWIPGDETKALYEELAKKYGKGAPNIKLDADFFARAQQAMRKEMGEEEFAALWHRRERYFAQFQGILDRYKAEGLIDEDQYKKLSRFDYSPIQFLDAIDESVPDSTKSRGSVRSSGIQALGKGARKQVERDSEMLLAQAIMRSEGRIGRNRAGKAMLKLAEEKPDNGVVSLKKVDGWFNAQTMVDGKPTNIWLEPEAGQHWVMSPEAPHQWLNIASGGFIVRPLATGINPGFILTNFPRDISYVLRYTDHYNPVLPVAYAQMARDLFSVAGAAVRRDGLFDEYIERGGGMNLLTHQGQGAVNTTSDVLKGVAQTKWRRLQHILGWANETSEIMVRLAVMQRAKRNGMDPEMAAHAARSYIDFAQGGSWSKQADAAVPYLNASIQGLRGVGRTVRNNPAKLAFKIGQTMTFYAGMSYWAHEMYPETMDEIPPEVKAKNVIIPTPYYWKDRRGQRRNMYMAIPIEHSMYGTKALTDALMSKHRDGSVPSQETLNIIRSTGEGLAGFGLVPPSLKAFYTYASNRDFWRNAEIWRRGPVMPEDEVYDLPNEPTSALAKDIAGVLSELNPLPGNPYAEQHYQVSPARLQSAAGSMIPQNPYTALLGGGYQLLREGWTEDMKDREMEEILAKTPILRRWLRSTHPYSTESARNDLLRAQWGSEKYDRVRKMDETLWRFGRGDLTQGAVRTYIRGQPEMHQKELAERFERFIQIDRVYKRTNYREQNIGLPSQTFWLDLMGMAPEVRADAYYHVWQEADMDEENGALKKRYLRRLVRQLPQVRTKEFALHLRKIHQERSNSPSQMPGL